jgi:hypothetical protein
MKELITSGIVDVIVGLIMFQFLILISYVQSTGRGRPPIGLVAKLLAGLFVLRALRGSLADENWMSTALWLGGPLIAHSVDLRQRWLKPPQRTPHAR